jgi:hypothetical protein
LLTGAYANVQPPPIGYPPTFNSIYDQVANISFSYTTPRIVLIPSFTIGGSFLSLTFPGLSIPPVTLFSFSMPGWLAEFVAGIWYVILYIVYILMLIVGLIGWLFTLVASATSLVSSIPVAGPILLTLFFVDNFIIVWEIVKMLRGYGGF